MNLSEELSRRPQWHFDWVFQHSERDGFFGDQMTELLGKTELFKRNILERVLEVGSELFPGGSWWEFFGDS